MTLETIMQMYEDIRNDLATLTTTDSERAGIPVAATMIVLYLAKLEDQRKNKV